jgi:hypothetical protein
MESGKPSNDLEGMRTPKDLKRGLIQPKVQTRPLEIDSKNNDFWAHFGTQNQPGNSPESKSNG